MFKALNRLALPVTLTLGLLGCTSVVAPAPPDSMFLATLQEETLKPRQTPLSCDETFSLMGHATSRSASTQVCVTNSCGWSEVKLRVVQRIIGSASARYVRLHSALGEWCRPILFGQDAEVFLVVTGTLNPSAEGVDFDVLPAFETDGRELAFVPQAEGTRLLSSMISPAQITSLLRPITPRAFRSEPEGPSEQSKELLQLPYVCKTGSELAYCKAIFVRELVEALKRTRP